VTDTEVKGLAESVRASLATLKDVAGVTGSFVCTESGRLVAREIPAMFESAVLAEAGSRLVRVAETFAAAGDELDLAVVRYGDHRLHLKVIAGGMLCIVVAGPVNMPALRMAASLVARRIASAVARVQSELPMDGPEIALPSAPLATPADKAPAREAPAGMRRFRGRELG
jgi:predicted regulator of Ras-like GTPase activity (Roadblock/LC7/MglB family)